MSIPQKACFLCYFHAKNFYNWSKFDKVLSKNKFAQFFETRCSTVVLSIPTVGNIPSPAPTYMERIATQRHLCTVALGLSASKNFSVFFSFVPGLRPDILQLTLTLTLTYGP